MNNAEKPTSRAQYAWELAMLLLAVGSIALVAGVELADLDWPDPAFRRWALVDLGFVLVFLVDFAVGLIRAPQRGAFLRAHWYDLIGLMPLYIESWSWLRAFRLLRVVRVLRLLRLVPAARRAVRNIDFVRRLVRDSHITYLLGVAGILIFIIATGFWIIEHRTNEAIRDFDDALWWAITTVTTVGYGDIAPRTGVGRVLASVLMFLGIGLVGAVGASLTATMLRHDKKENAMDSVRALLFEHERLVVARERGELSQEDYERRCANLLAIAQIKTESD